MFKRIWNFVKRKRIDGTVLEEYGEVTGIAFGDERIGVQLFKKMVLSDKPLIRLVLRSRHVGKYHAWAVDLTPSEADKLISLIEKAKKNS